MKFGVFSLFLIFSLFVFFLNAKNLHATKKMNTKYDHHSIHPKFRRMVWDPNWGDKDKFTDDGTAEPGVILNQLKKIEEYRRGEIKKRIRLLKRPPLVEGACRSIRD